MTTTKRPTVSVCMITYGHEAYIKQAIEGVLMQEGDIDIELIIADDCSPDDTKIVVSNIISKHPKASCIRYTKHKRNKGMIPNFVWTLKQCKGKYIALCEGDDYWTDPLKLQKQVDFLDSHLEYVLSFHTANILELDNNVVKDYITRVPENHETLTDFLEHGNYIHTPTVVFRNIISEFPFEFNLVPYGDFFLYTMLAQYGKLKYFDEIMGVYRANIGAISKMSERQTALSYATLYSCIISFLNDEELKKIVLEKQQQVLNGYYQQVEDKYWNLKRNHKEAFVTHNLLFKGVKQLQMAFWKIKNNYQ